MDYFVSVSEPNFRSRETGSNLFLISSSGFRLRPAYIWVSLKNQQKLFILHPTDLRRPYKLPFGEFLEVPKFIGLTNYRTLYKLPTAAHEECAGAHYEEYAAGLKKYY